MPIRFSLDFNLPCVPSTEKCLQEDSAGHSRLAGDPSRASEILEKLLRIHARQAASGSPASHWDPVKIWREMLQDCCSKIDSRT